MGSAAGVAKLAAHRLGLTLRAYQSRLARGLKHCRICRKWLDWVVSGGESGPGARPQHPDWPRLVRDDCAASFTPFLYKQWGAWEIASAANGHAWSTMPDSDAYCWVTFDGKMHRIAAPIGSGHEVYAMARVGKAKSGRLLDGVEHNGYPK